MLLFNPATISIWEEKTFNAGDHMRGYSHFNVYVTHKLYTLRATESLNCSFISKFIFLPLKLFQINCVSTNFATISILYINLNYPRIISI